MVLNLATMVNVTEKSASVQVSVSKASEIQTNVFCDSGVQKFSRFFRAAPSSCLLEVVDKGEAWNEEEWLGSRLAACMWFYTKAALCDGQGSTQENLRRKLSTIMESVSWVCEVAFEGPRVGNGTQCLV